MKRNSAWVTAIIMHIALCLAFIVNILIFGSNIWSIICFFLFIRFAFQLQNLINYGPAYYVTYIIPKEDIERHVYNNLIVLSDGKGTANAFYDRVKEIAELPAINVNLYYNIQKQEHSWAFDPYTSLNEMRRSQR